MTVGDRSSVGPAAGRSPALLTASALAIFAVLVCVRMPQIVLQGRFWAEEGHNFFYDGWTMTAWRALFVPIGGYLNLVANASTLAASRVMPLKLAPYLTISVALLVQLCPPLLLLTARDAWLASVRARISGCLLLLVVPASEEIWLQTLHCQFELTLCCCLIITLQTGPRSPGRLFVLLLAPLCGPGAIALMPLMLARVASDRSWARVFQFLALGLGSSIQLAVILAGSRRGSHLDLQLLPCVATVRHLAVPFLGVTYGNEIATSINARLAAGRTPLLATVMPLVVFGSLAAATLVSARSRPARWLLAAAVLVGGASYVGAIGGPATLIDARIGERYVFVPQALIALTVLVLALTANRWISRVAWVGVSWLLVAGAASYLQPWPMIADGPSWRREVALWRSDHTHPLHTWPQGWTISLDGPR